MSDTFSRYHPAVNFLFFALVLVYSMVLMHPVCLLISLLGAVLYVIQLNGRKGLRFSLRFALPVMLLAAIVNPAFNHAGVTILSPRRQSPDAGEHPVRPCGGMHAVRRAAVVRVLQSCSHLR